MEGKNVREMHGNLKVCTIIYRHLLLLLRLLVGCLDDGLPALDVLLLPCLILGEEFLLAGGLQGSGLRDLVKFSSTVLVAEGVQLIVAVLLEQSLRKITLD